ncbi:amidohydrolase [Microbacterium sp. ASV49]|uniref:Amidohydrolase n=1 Tax=Microbacterium candidum TaxID=3041922 RepID=A0ABT7N4I7_9MICO|nr:amidohydrolase [Microbacterium sp. ASV49]MDL9981596.1 amidohydrolase [Microbacterium sp. ASV49]
MPAADVLFTGGSVFTGEGDAVAGLTVAVTDGRISAVVPDAEAAALRGPDTQVIALEGALLSPGFQDAHVHPVGGGVELLQCNLTEAENAEEAVATVARYAAENPDAEWILGGGWSMDHFPGGAPVRTLLDGVVPDRPILISSRDHHSAWANTAAIRAAGLDASTPDPVDGRIEREADGFPAGTFHEGASGLFDAVLPESDADLAYLGLLRAQEELLAVGITGWQDALIGAMPGVPGNLDSYLRALREGTLRAHVVGAQWWERGQGLEQLEGMIRTRDQVAALGMTERLSVGTIKFMVDGVAENHTAAMLEPYRDACGHDTDNRGLSFIAPEALREYVVAADAAGFQPHFHALGDRAVREALDAVEAARAANGDTDSRPHLAHIQVVTEEDAARFAGLGAVANMQPLWATHEDQLDNLTLPFLQDGQEARQYPFGELQRDGARLAGGSDWPVSSADPIAGIHIAVTRVAPGSGYEPLGGDGQRLDLATAFAAYTSGSAYVNHRDHDTGYVREGYLANLIVVSPNPFELDPSEIHTARVRSTWIEGEPVYTAAN